MKTKLLIASALGILALASCGSGSNPGTTPQEATTPSGSGGGAVPSLSSGMPSVAPGTVVNLDFWVPFGQTPLAATEAKAAEFSQIIQRETGVTVNVNVSYQGSYDDIRSKILQGFATANVPTLAVAYPDHVASYLGSSRDYVYDMTPYFDDPTVGFGTQSYLGDSEEYDEEDIIAAYFEEGTRYTIEGTFSYPLMKSSEVMFYNADAVELIMAALPDTFLPNASRATPQAFLDDLSWEDLIEVARFAKQNKSRILDTLEEPIWYDSDSNLFISKMYQNKIDFTSIDANGSGVIAFESGEARSKTEAMVNALASAAQEGIITTKGVKDTYGSDSFSNGKCIFEIGSSGGAGYTAPSGAAFNYSVTMVPASNENPLYISQGPDVAFIRNPGLSQEENDLRVYYAWQFVKFLTNPSSNVYLCVYGSEGYVPIRYSAYESAAYQQFLAEGESIAETARVLSNKINGRFLNTDIFVGSAELRDQVGGVLTQVFKGLKDTKTAIDDAISYTKTFIK